jgi:hypothetical protein
MINNGHICVIWPIFKDEKIYKINNYYDRFLKTLISEIYWNLKKLKFLKKMWKIQIFEKIWKIEFFFKFRLIWNLKKLKIWIFWLKNIFEIKILKKELRIKTLPLNYRWQSFNFQFLFFNFYLKNICSIKKFKFLIFF